MSLDFNHMLDKCCITALGITKQAKLYQASSPRDLSFIHCIFRGNAQYATVMVNCTKEGAINTVTIDSPYLDDCVIHPPLKMTQAQSVEYLNIAGYGTWTTVVLREPLGPSKFNPLYIYTVPNIGYVAVDSVNGNVFLLM